MDESTLIPNTIIDSVSDAQTSLRHTGESTLIPTPSLIKSKMHGRIQDAWMNKLLFPTLSLIQSEMHGRVQDSWTNHPLLKT